MQDRIPQETVLTDYARRVIRFKAWQLSHQPGFRRSEREDLQQEMWNALLIQIDNFDPERASLNTFIDRVVTTTAALLLRARRREKRAEEFSAQSLDAPVLSEEGTTSLGCLITESESARRTGSEHIEHAIAREDAAAFRHAWDSLPDELREICREVRDGSITSASQALSISRRQIRNALEVVREYFVEAGF